MNENQNGLQNTSTPPPPQSPPNTPVYGGYPAYTPLPKKESYTGRETVGAFIVYALAFIFCRSFPFVTYPLGCFTVCALTVMATAVFLYLKKTESSDPMSYAFFGCAVLLTLSPLFSSNLILILISYAIFFCAILMFLFFRHKNGTGSAKAEYIAFDFLDAVIEHPLSYGNANLVSAFIHPIRKGKFKSVGRQLGYILLGLVLTLVPTVFVLVNLSFDSKFTSLLSDMFRLDGIEDGIGYVFSALFALPVALYMYAAIWSYSCREKDGEDTVKLKEKHDKAKSGCKALPAISIITASVPLMFLYVVFFISQIENYTSAFSGVLPDGFIYSDYARSGFFELCRVAGLNAVLFSLLIQ